MSDQYMIIHDPRLSAARDKRLSYEARGLFADLLSRPDNWKITVDSLVQEGVKRDKVQRLLDELVTAGYLEAPGAKS